MAEKYRFLADTPLEAGEIRELNVRRDRPVVVFPAERPGRPSLVNPYEVEELLHFIKKGRLSPRLEHSGIVLIPNDNDLARLERERRGKNARLPLLRLIVDLTKRFRGGSKQ